MRLTALASFLTLALCLVAGTVVHAAESAPFATERDSVTLVSASDAVQPGQPTRFGLHFHLAPGWHTYWKNPGDAGEPVALTVTLSGGATGQASAIEWPTPQRLPEGPLMSYGYTSEVLLPVTLRPEPGDDTTVQVKAHAEWLVCAAVCVPEQADFTLTLPKAPPTPSAEAPLFTQAAARVPKAAPFSATIAPDGVLTLSGAGLSSRHVTDAWFIPDTPGIVDQVAPQPLARTGSGLTLKLKPLDAFHAGTPLDGLVELHSPDAAPETLAIHAHSVAMPAAPIQPPPAMPDGWLTLAGLAFLGGLILNLMPCVFPVLAMKAVGLARGQETGHRVRGAMAYMVGVLLTFAALGAITLAIRHAGIAAGWGFQFQSPVFVTAICWLLFIVALGLLGVFELPVIGAGQTAISRTHGVLADFFTGLLAVLVATPCTAPFMGAAIAGALATSPLAAMGIFLSMGLGLAAPFVLLAVLPGAGRLLPRPGAWMDTLRQFLAFPVLGTCVWLIWVLDRQVGSTGVLLLGTSLLMVGFGGWLAILGRNRAQGSYLRVAALIVCLLPLPLLAVLPPAGVVAHTPDASDVTPYSPGRLAALRKERRPVFVDMTAAWCITCLVNERVTLDSARVRSAFAQQGVTYMKGDWTNRDASIAAFLHEHGRDGVPLYVFYPRRGEGRVLPQILTPDLVISALTH
ncbi:protein-disulfide reductase DsbD family protein [Acetobacter estunensis]|uniref:protein-disulfide reductase DsbD family protein n=1 Tax=Acetobacter estunensis TaxID=104097 RepID=UPI0034A05096